MASLNRMVAFVLFSALYFTVHLEGFSLNRVKRDDTEDIYSRIFYVGSLTFDDTLAPQVIGRRVIRCRFLFDKAASALLNGDPYLGTSYVTQLALLTSKYTAHANIEVVNGGVLLFGPTADEIVSFPVNVDATTAMPNILSQFQAFLGTPFGTVIFGTLNTMAVFISNNSLVQGGYSQGPQCTTYGTAVIHYRDYPWSIARLLAHEIGHTLGLIHPNQLPLYCQQIGSQEFSFCQSTSIPDNCACTSSSFPSSQCLMSTDNVTPQMVNAPKYTPCDIEMMNYFSSNSTTPCLFPATPSK